MKKVVVLLLFISMNFCFGKTWTQIAGGCNCYGETNDSLLVNSTLEGGVLLFGDSALTLFSANPVADIWDDYGATLSASGYALNFSGYCTNAAWGYDDACLKLRMGFYQYEKTENLKDAIVFQKQKMDNFDAQGFLGDSLNISDTNYFYPLRITDTIAPNPDSLFAGDFFENNSLSEESLLDTVQFIFKMDSSYYAFCRYIQSKGCWSLLFQCEVQDDGTTEFAPFETVEYPYPYYNPTGEKCLTKSEYEDYLAPISASLRRKTHAVQQKTPVPYRIDGSRSRGGASSVIIRGGRPEAVLRK